MTESPGCIVTEPKDVCRRFAKAGYFAIAPELYARQGDPSKVSDVQAVLRDIVSKVPDKQVMADLDAAVAWAMGSGKADTVRLAITGFCWGGASSGSTRRTTPGSRRA